MIKINDSIYLDIIKESDKEQLQTLANHPVMRKNVWDTMPYPYTEKDAERWINHSQELVNSETERNYAIYIDWLYAGNLWWDVKDSWRSSHNYHFWYWLWEPYRWKWYMTEIAKWFISHIFDTRKDANRIYAKVFWRNQWSRRVLEKCWLQHEWTFRKAILWDWEYYDEWIFSILREEYDRN